MKCDHPGHHVQDCPFSRSNGYDRSYSIFPIRAAPGEGSYAERNPRSGGSDRHARRPHDNRDHRSQRPRRSTGGASSGLVFGTIASTPARGSESSFVTQDWSGSGSSFTRDGVTQDWIGQIMQRAQPWRFEYHDYFLT